MPLAHGSARRFRPKMNKVLKVLTFSM